MARVYINLLTFRALTRCATLYSWILTRELAKPLLGQGTIQHRGTLGAHSSLRGKPDRLPGQRAFTAQAGPAVRDIYEKSNKKSGKRCQGDNKLGANWEHLGSWVRFSRKGGGI